MIRFCPPLPRPASLPGGGAVSQLMFMCRAAGDTEAIPRILHKHDERFELMFIASGRGNYIIDGRSYQVKAGDILLFNAGVLHDETPEPSAELLIFSCGVENLQIAGLPANCLIARDRPAVVPSGEYYNQFHPLFTLIWFHLNHQSSHGVEIANTLLHTLLLLCRHLFQTQPAGEYQRQEPDREIGDYIDRHFQDDFSLSSVTAKTQLNPFYAANRFKRSSGFSPSQYQARRRIGEAQTLLLGTDWEVSQVATFVGYNNVSNFHRIFHNLIGISPLRYRHLWLKDSR